MMGVEKMDYRNDERFNIINIANLCGIEIIKILKTGKRALAKCPFCNDTSGHLYLTIQDGEYYNVYKCVHCGAHGPAIDLYVNRYGVDRKTAAMEIKGEIATRNATNVIKEIEKNQVFMYDIKPVEHLDEVYRTLLDMQTLNEEDHSNLLNRGLTDSTIKFKGYKSLPSDFESRKSICNKLENKFDLAGVPGFFKNKYGYWDMYAPRGFLIPVRDRSGRIPTMQIRLTKPQVTAKGKKIRYKSFSSAGIEYGTKANAHVHVAYGRNTEQVVITEGPLKADVSSHLTGLTFFGVPGVAIAHAELVETLKASGVKKADIAFDMDVIEKIEVQKALASLCERLSQNDIEYNIQKWYKLYQKNHNIKGIDDYLWHQFKKA